MSNCRRHVLQISSCCCKRRSMYPWGVHTTLAKCSYQPANKHHSPLKNCKEAVDIKSTLHIFESVASLLYRELGFPKQKNLGVQPKLIAMRRAKSKTNMLLNLLSQSTPGGSRCEIQSTPCLLYPNPFHRMTACKKKTQKDLEEN